MVEKTFTRQERSYTVDDLGNTEYRLSPSSISAISTFDARNYERLLEYKTLLRRLYSLKKQIHARMLTETDVPQLCILIRQHDLFTTKMEHLEDQLDRLRWTMIDRLSFTGIGNASSHLTSILSEIGFAVGQFSIFGAALSFSLLYSAQRGDLSSIYVSWWLFLSSLVTVGALSVAGAGSDPSSLTPTRRNWMKRAFACGCVLLSFFTMVAGLAFLAMAAVDFDVSEELVTGEQRLSGGPTHPHGIQSLTKAIGYAIIWAAAFCFALGLVASLRPRFRRAMGKKRALRQKFFTSEQELRRRHRAYSYDDDMGGDKEQV